MSALPHVTRTDHDATTVVVYPVGEFDIAGTDLLRSTFLDAVSATKNKLIIDLSGTTFLDSMALGTIIGARRRVAGWGGWVRLVAPQPNIHRVLRLTELDKVFGLYDTVEQAAAHVTEELDGSDGTSAAS